MSAYMFVADVVTDEGETKMSSGICYGLSQADAEVDAIKQIEEQHRDSKEITLRNVRDWAS